VGRLEEAILIAAEERLIVEGLKFSLEQDGYIIDTAYDLEEVLKKAEQNSYMLIVVDISSFGVEGYNIYQTIKEKCGTPVIVLTASVEVLDKAVGLEYGAHDYMIKPVNIQELKSRIRAAIKKAEGKNNSAGGVIKLWKLTIDTSSRKVSEGNREIKLTAKEYEILVMLAMNKNKIYSREDLLKAVWSDYYSGDKRIVDVHIRRLREKIETDPANPLYIMTKWGVGYYFNG
jgi:two-component system, OmpR family, response regulator VicR